MNPSEDQKDSSSAGTTNTKGVIQPVNPDEVKAAMAENSKPNIPPAATTPPAQNTVESPKTPNQSAPQAQDEGWKPSGTLARRIPALRNYGIVLILGSIFFMYINRSIWKFSDQSAARSVGIMIYAVLGVMFVSGMIILLSKSKVLVQLCLNIIIGLSLLVGALSLASLNIVTVLFSVVIIGSVLNIKRYVKHAA